VFPVELYDLALLPFLKPVVSWDLTVVIVVLSIPLAPCVELTHPNPQTPYKNTFIELPLMPVADEVHHLVTAIWFNPASF
jgi:hypothetical protein